MLLQMDGEQMVEFMGQLFDGCLSALEVTPFNFHSFASLRRAILLWKDSDNSKGIATDTLRKGREHSIHM